MKGRKHVLQKAVGSFKWSVLAELISRVSAVLIYIILARLLTPQDFGLVASAMICVSFSSILWDAGLSKALIQSREKPESAANVVFWLNLSLGLLVYCFLYILAPSLSHLFKNPSAKEVIRALGFQIIILSLTSVQQALFTREFQFFQIFWIKIATSLMPGFISIPLAYLGYGVWAIVAGYLTGSLVNLFLFWFQSPWRPKFNFDFGLAKKLINFGLWVVGEALLSWFFIYGDNLVVGTFLGVHALGLYSVGWNITSVLFGLVLNPFLPVLYPTFSRLRHDRDMFLETFYKANQLMMSLALPLGMGFLILGPEIATVFFGNQWQELGFIIRMIGFMHGITWLVGINPDTYRALGRPDINTKLMMLALIYYVPSFLIGVKYGLVAFVITRFVVAALSLPLHIYFCVQLLKISPIYLWNNGKIMIQATLFMALIIIIIKLLINTYFNIIPVIWQWLFLTLLGFIFYLLIIWLLDKSYLLQAKDLLKKAIYA